MDQLKSIIKGCLKNDKKSQKRLFEMHYGKMMPVAMRYTRDDDSASEIIQESFIKAFDKLSTYNSDGNFEGWLKRIVVNTAIDKIRKNKKFIFIDDSVRLEDAKFLITKDEEFEIDTSSLEAEKILKILQSLPDGYRTVFNMRVFEEMSHKEIADELGIVEGTSKSNYHRARAILQSKVLELQS